MEALCEDLRVLVTGASSGLGRAMAQALSDAGAQVVVTSRDVTRAKRTAEAMGKRALGVGLDVRDPGSINAAISSIEAYLGGIDLLVCNAGIGMRTVNPNFLTDPQPFWTVEADGFRNVFDTKVMGTFLVARAIVPGMLERGSGRIVVISMNTETMSRKGFIPYGPSGAAVEAMAGVMIEDLRESGVTVNILLPGGATNTGMIPEGLDPSRRAQLLDPSIMGPPIVWLASAASEGVHGRRIVATEFASLS
ncbi:MAG: SDR family NAD(P)-dependent oxidoreductase [Acidimicrobiales bacterium]